MAKARTAPKSAAKKPARKRPAKVVVRDVDVSELVVSNEEAITFAAPALGVTDPGTTLGAKSTNPDGIKDPGSTLDSN